MSPRTAYEFEVLNNIADWVRQPTVPPRRMGESDDQHTARTDAALQDRLFAAAAEMEAAINAVNANSSVMEISLGSFQDWRHDQDILTREYWNAKLQERE